MKSREKLTKTDKNIIVYIKEHNICYVYFLDKHFFFIFKLKILFHTSLKKLI